MMYKNNNGFTLVELIVVITILAILGTIAFISLGGYAVIARETSRLADINVISRALDLSYTENEFYPDTASGIAITYSGSVLWNQGYFNDTVRAQLRRISETPVDVLLGVPYIYSVTYNRQEYQLGGAGERGKALNAFHVIPRASASFSKAIVKGNYNGAILGKEIDNLVYIFGVPSIITQSTGTIDLQSVYDNGLYVVNNFSALPLGFSGTQTESPKIDFTLQNSDDFVLYSGTKENLVTGNGILDFSQKLYLLYDDTVFENNPDISKMLPSIESESQQISQTAQHILATKSLNSIISSPKLQSEVRKHIQTSSSSSAENSPTIFTFDFTNLLNQEVDLEVYSQTLTVSGIDTPLNLSISGEGDPAIQIDGGDWGSTGSIVSGQTIRIKMTTSPTPEQSRSVTFTYGSNTKNWSTSTRNYAACPIGTQEYVYNIPDADMQNGASYNGKGQCSATGSLNEGYGLFWKEDANGTWNRVGYDASPNNIGECTVHNGRLSYTTGPRAGEYDNCMCTIFVQCTSSGAITVGHTW